MAVYTKGGLGDVRQIPEDEFDRLYVAMLVHSDLIREQVDKEAAKARAEKE